MERASGRPGFTVDGFLNASANGQVRLQGEDPAMPRQEVAGEEKHIYSARQVVLGLDEASLVGAKQAGPLLQVVEDLQARGVQAKLHLIGDTRQMQAIQSGDFFRRVLESGREGWADIVSLNEINRQRDREFLEIAKTLNLEGRSPATDAREALSALTARGDLIEKARGDELIASTEEMYLVESGWLSRDPDKAARGERQLVLLITSTNADRKELNRQIRAARIFSRRGTGSSRSETFVTSGCETA